MGVEALIGTIVGGMAVGGHIEGNIKADEMRRAAGAQAAEQREATQLRRERGERFKEQQALALAASGVQIEGTPLDVLEQTQRDIELEFEQGMERASNIRREGRRAADRMPLQGFISGAQAGVQTAASLSVLKSGGFF